MQFKTATDRAAGACITMADIAKVLNVAENTVNRARMDQDNPNARPAPAGWQAAVAKLARERSVELAELADQLQRGGVTR